MFSSIKNDECAINQQYEQSEGPGVYAVETPAIRESCLPRDARIISQKGADSQPWNYAQRFYYGPVDVESDLMNIDRPASDCPENKYDPRYTNCGCENQGEPGGAGVISGCTYGFLGPSIQEGQKCGDNTLVNIPQCNFGVEDTRLSNPASNLRGTGWNRFDPIALDPQAQLLFPGAYNINSRLLTKDNHRPCVRTPNVNNMNPPPMPAYQEQYASVKTAPTAPLYQYNVFG